MKIPVFVSCPTVLTEGQEAFRQIVIEELERFDLEERRVGASDYPTELTLREVLVLAKHCAGAIILGFEQLHVEAGTWKRKTEKTKPVDKPMIFPTPWNHLEAGVLFGLRLPLLVFREEGIEGGVSTPASPRLLSIRCRRTSYCLRSREWAWRRCS